MGCITSKKGIVPLNGNDSKLKTNTSDVETRNKKKKKTDSKLKKGEKKLSVEEMNEVVVVGIPMRTLPPNNNNRTDE